VITRLLVDEFVADSQQFLCSSDAAPNDWRVDVFNPFLTPTELVTTFREHTPDVVVVDGAWLLIAPLLVQLLKASGCANPLRIIAARKVDNVLKVQAAHHGFADFVDLGTSSGQFVADLSDSIAGRSRLRDDPLWRLISRPAYIGDVTGLVDNATDKEIVELIRMGVSDNDIAECLFLSPQTVRNRVSSMLHRAGLSNRTQMAWAYTNQALALQMMSTITPQQ
jgi:DNA-binding NarL/FixJ family response regulator